jgi:lysine biosynthesis protein LysW
MSTVPNSTAANTATPAVGLSDTATRAHSAPAADVSNAPTACPECDASIRLDRPPLRGQVIRCTDCGVELEVTRTAPLALELAPEVREDWGE